MHDNDYEVKEANWENVENDKCGEINFKKKQRNIKRVFKGVSFIVIAALSGAISSSYIVEKRYSNFVREDKKINEIEKKQYNFHRNAGEETCENYIGRIAESVGPTVVGIVSNGINKNGKDMKVTGSGIIFESNGYILTNYHIIEGYKDIKVKLASGQDNLEAKFIGSDSGADLAVIKIDAKNLPIAKFGDSHKVKVGDKAIAIGNSLIDDFPGTVTSGIISSSNKRIKGNKAEYKVFRTDASINKINNGGALCNEEGYIIGINNFKLKKQYNEDMGVAVVIDQVKPILSDIMKNIQNKKPQLGIIGRCAVPEDSNGVKGVYISEVKKKSGAEKAGIKPTDIIIEVEDTSVNESDNILDILESHKIGDSIKCKIWRNGKTINKNVTLLELK